MKGLKLPLSYVLLGFPGKKMSSGMSLKETVQSALQGYSRKSPPLMGISPETQRHVTYPGLAAGLTCPMDAVPNTF